MTSCVLQPANECRLGRGRGAAAAEPPLPPVDGENMNRFERPERNIRPPQQVLWKRSQQQHRSGQDHYRLSSNEHYLHSRELNRGTNYLDHTTGIVDGYGPTNLYQAQRIPQLMGLHDNIVMLDELTLRHMVQDCTSVKTQLLKLKKLLQSEDPASMHDSELSTPVTPEPHDDAETTLKEEHFGEFDDDLSSPIRETFANDSSPMSPKVNKNKFTADDLLNEIRHLRAEAKTKDDRIKQLEHQLATRCNCGKEPLQIQQSRVTLRSHCDKFTQTPWRNFSPQVLQHPISIPSTTDHFQGTLARSSPSEDLTEDHSEPYTEALEKEARELSDLFSTQIDIEDFDHDGPSEESLQTNTFAVSRQQAWSEVEQPQICSSFMEESQIELQDKFSLKKPSITLKSRPKTLPLSIPRKESPTSPQEEASSELTTSRSKTCIQPQLQTADDLVTELPSMCDSPSEVQLPCASPPLLPPTLVNHLQPSNTGLLQLHVSVTNPSHLHLTVANPSQQYPANAGLSHMPVTCLPEFQSPLESLSLPNGLEDNTSQLPLPGDTPSLLYTESDIPSSTFARLNVLIQPSFMDTDHLPCEVAARTERQAQVQTIPPTKFSDASPSMIKPPSASQKTLKLPAGVSKSLKSATAYSAKTIPVNSIMGKTPSSTSLMLNSPAAIPSSMRSSAPNPAGVMPPADSQTLKSTSANPTSGKLPVTKQLVRKVSSASTSAQRLRTSSPSKQQSPQASPSKQKAPEVSLLLVKPPLDPSMASLEISAVKQTLKYSKLRPPSVVHVKSKQTDSPDRSSTLIYQDPQKSPVKGTTSNIPRMMTQKKDLHNSDGINPSRLSRLPKPKTQ